MERTLISLWIATVLTLKNYWCSSWEKFIILNSKTHLQPLTRFIKVKQKNSCYQSTRSTVCIIYQKYNYLQLRCVINFKNEMKKSKEHWYINVYNNKKFLFVTTARSIWPSHFLTPHKSESRHLMVLTWHSDGAGLEEMLCSASFLRINLMAKK